MNLRSAVLAHFLLKEKLQKLGVVGCVSCIVGSVVIVIHAPQEHTPNSIEEIWTLATQPGSVPLFKIFFFWLNNILFLSNNCLTFFFSILRTAFLIYVAATLSLVLALILHFEPRYGQTNVLVYLGICSLMGSITVSTFPL